MYRTLLFLLFILAGNIHLHGQARILKGRVKSADGKNLPGASITIQQTNIGIVTDDKGDFVLQEMTPDKQVIIKTTYVGYQPSLDTIAPDETGKIIIRLKPGMHNIDEIVIHDAYSSRRHQETPVPIEIINVGFIEKNAGNSLMQSIKNLPGVSSMNIGSGFSKPVIRGLSFNRVVVTERGIKQEGQQWGADHGLAIDQYNIERLEIIKGPASVIYGSDAIGGVVKIKAPFIPARSTLRGEVLFNGQSNNQLAGSSIMLTNRNDDWFFKIRATGKLFGDYRVPKDTIIYLSRKMPLNKERPKNTAGREYNLSMTNGWIKSWGRTDLTFSHVHQKSGFFPGAHGIPDMEDLKNDHNMHNIKLPYQNVDHLKVISSTKLEQGRGRWNIDLAYQLNHRQEWSNFHTHYPDQEPPLNNPNLELDFMLNTGNINLRYQQKINDEWNIQAGADNQFKSNTIKGYAFLMPEYQSHHHGIYFYPEWNLSAQTMLSAGIRYDLGITNISPYRDTYAANFLDRYYNNWTKTKKETYIYRSNDVERSFHDIIWSIGINHKFTKNVSFKANAGKSFRTPNAMELAANGIHHGSFRYEQGNARLTSEKGYQMDLSGIIQRPRWELSISPFIQYFSNFIYLRPTLKPAPFFDAGYIYAYVQNPALRYGGEFHLKYQISQVFRLGLNGEHIETYRMDSDPAKRYTLPFTPPSKILSEIIYMPNQLGWFLNQNEIKIETEWVADQDNHAINELPTPGYMSWNFSFSSYIALFKQHFRLLFKVNNLFDRQYYDHISFYRYLEMPEPGRNFILSLKIPFEHYHGKTE